MTNSGLNRKKINSSHAKPYLLLAMAALVACLPVTSMLFTLKNDVLAIEYPFLHIISECIRNGESPIWFNTWCLGFPLQSTLTWGVYSSPAVLTGTLLPFDIYVLHAMFVFFVMSSGWAMFKLLSTHFLEDRMLSLLFSCCYMLSGFTVSSSQWLLYITGMTFIPIVLYCTLTLLKNPSLKRSFYWGISCFLLLTNVHIYLTVITSYFLFFFFIFFLLKHLFIHRLNTVQKKRLLLYSASAIIIACLLCAAPVYYTIETLSKLERSNPLLENSAFFRSNYLHPDGLKSLLLPLSTINTRHFNTEGSILNIYMGLLPVILLVPALFINFHRKNNKARGLLLISVFFLLLSFGHLTPLREWLNILPGLSHFRHPGVLRIFFIMAFILYLGATFNNLRLSDILQPGSPERRLLIISLTLVSLVSFIVLAGHYRSFTGLWKGSFYESIKSIQHGQLVLINSITGFIFSLLLLLSLYKKRSLFPVIVITELIINFLCCTPFYAVSSFSVKKVNRLIQGEKGFPVQDTYPFDAPADIKNQGITVWRNTNTYKKEVSLSVSMPGPLILKEVAGFLESGEQMILRAKPLVFIKDSSNSVGSLKITEQRPTRIKVNIDLPRQGEIVLQQASFPGWKVFYNGSRLPLLKNEFPFISVMVPKGKGELVFRFEKKGVVLSATILHALVLLTLVIAAGRKMFTRSSSPS